MALAKSSQIYYINSNSRKDGSSSDFSYEMRMPTNEHFDRVVLLQASIPSTFYLIQTGYNTFTLREGLVDTTITVVPGNYSAKVFAAHITALMTAASPNTWVYTVTLPNLNSETSTGKFTYSVTGNGGSQPSIIVPDTIDEQLGFTASTTNTFVGDTLTSTRVVNFCSESTLFIHSDIADGGETSILQELYVSNTAQLSYITYQCTTPELYSKPLQTNKSNIFRFSLTNEKNQLVDLQGNEMLLTLALYRRDDLGDYLRKYIKYKLQTESTS